MAEFGSVHAGLEENIGVWGQLFDVRVHFLPHCGNNRYIVFLQNEEAGGF